MKWSEIGIDNVMNSEYIELFLKDVETKLNVYRPSLGCKRCIKDYFNRLTSLEMDKKEINITECSYTLLVKREGIQLETGGSDFLTNQNLTDEKAEKLIKRLKSLNSKFEITNFFSRYKGEEKPKVVLPTQPDPVLVKDIKKEKTDKPKKAASDDFIDLSDL